MNWYKKAKAISIYRGENSSNKNGHYYSIDKNFAAQFTQTGQIKEVITKKIDLSLIYDSRKEGKPLPSANNENEFDNAMARAKELGLVGFRLTEGVNQPDSIYLINKVFAS